MSDASQTGSGFWHRFLVNVSQSLFTWQLITFNVDVARLGSIEVLVLDCSAILGFMLLLLSLWTEIQTFITSALLCRLCRIFFTCNSHHEWAFVGGPTTSRTHPRWRTAAMLKSVKFSVLEEDICTQFGTKVQRGAEYRRQLQDGFQRTV